MLPVNLDSRAKEFLINTVNIDNENEKMKHQFKEFKKNLITE